MLTNIFYEYTLNPWDNFRQGGISDDNSIYGIGSWFFLLINQISIVGVVVGVIIASIMLMFGSKMRDEGKRRFITVCSILLAICMFPGIINCVMRIITSIVG